ncbi:hypothetical protein BYT27DRAFT_7211611 [Phlegmacium glaucopus]|nr:hypothetical protein BYT27DRAFT_7211611 [Phlegmacium glaucopus]
MRLVVANLKDDTTKNLKGRVELSVGMKAMVVLNIATVTTLNGSEASGRKQSYKKLHVFGGDKKKKKKFVTATDANVANGTHGTVEGFVLDPREEHTRPDEDGVEVDNYKAQGQTMECVIINISKPPSGKLLLFSVYVTLSRSRGRKTIQILRDFNPTLFMHHPSEDLRADMARLERLNEKLKAGDDEESR